MLINNLVKVSIVTLALSCYVSAMDKWYIGASMGKSDFHFSLDRDLTINQPAFFFIESRKDSSNMDKKSFNCGFFAGYNYLIKQTPLFIGFEIGAQNYSLEATQEERTFPPFVNYRTKIRANNSLNGIFKIGIFIKDLMIYGKAGIARTKWTISFIDNNNEIGGSFSSQKFIKHTSLFGFGIDYILNSNWSIGMDCNMAHYPNLKLTHPIGEFKVSPSVGTTTFRLSYLF